MLQTRPEVLRIVPKCPEMSQNVQFRRIVVRMVLFNNLLTPKRKKIEMFQQRRF